MTTDIARNRAQSKYSTGEQVRRLLWTMVWPLFRLSPRPFFVWRRALLRLFGAKVGRAVNIYPSAHVYFPWKLDIGDWSAIGEHALIYNLGPVEIGCNVTISQRAHLCAGTHDYTRPELPLLKLPIRIGDQAWICADAYVGPGVTIGDGAVVGARAVAVRDVGSWEVVAGNPAKLVKMRQIKTNMIGS